MVLSIVIFILVRLVFIYYLIRFLSTIESSLVFLWKKWSFLYVLLMALILVRYVYSTYSNYFQDNRVDSSVLASRNAVRYFGLTEDEILDGFDKIFDNDDVWSIHTAESIKSCDLLGSGLDEVPALNHVEVAGYDMTLVDKPVLAPLSAYTSAEIAHLYYQIMVCFRFSYSNRSFQAHGSLEVDPFNRLAETVPADNNGVDAGMGVTDG